MSLPKAPLNTYLTSYDPGAKTILNELNDLTVGGITFSSIGQQNSSENGIINLTTSNMNMPPGWSGTLGKLIYSRNGRLVTLIFADSAHGIATSMGNFSSKIAIIPSTCRPIRNIYFIGKGANNNLASFVLYSINTDGTFSIQADLGVPFIANSPCGYDAVPITYTT